MKAKVTLGSEALVHIVGIYLGTNGILPEGEADFRVFEEVYEDGTSDMCMEVEVETSEAWSLDQVKERIYNKLKQQGYGEVAVAENQQS